MLNKKGMEVNQTLMILIISVILLFLTSCVFGRGIISLFRDSQSGGSFEKLLETINEVSDPSSEIKMKLVDMKLDEDTAIYLFSNASEIIERYSIVPGSVQRKDNIILKPLECETTGTCICLCRGFELAKTECTGDINTKYPNKCSEIYDLKCNDQIDCKIINAQLHEKTTLEAMLSTSGYENIKKKMLDDAKYFVYEWEQGASIWRTDEEPRNYMAASTYLDVYVVKSSDGKIKLCLDSDCYQDMGAFEPEQESEVVNCPEGQICTAPI